MWSVPPDRLRFDFRHATAIAALAVIGLAGCSRSRATNVPVASGPPPNIADIAASYTTSFQRITPQAVFVNPELAMLCRGADQSEVEAAAKVHGPHANMAVMIYVNDLAAQTFRSSGGAYAVGAVIVKEKGGGGFRERATGKYVLGHNGVGGMVKRAPGFDPAHGDWEYFYFENPGKIEAGKIASCVKCHDGARKTDYVFGTWANARWPASAKR